MPNVDSALCSGRQNLVTTSLTFDLNRDGPSYIQDCQSQSQDSQTHNREGSATSKKTSYAA